ncbi:MULTISPECIES: hydrogen peroxide-inducible genes activator [Corynebacterium]|uniref:hydrogen peroxide-inducible genes activator n=1 Tax=Corynebacterium TaxID=1716 RepID=UPI001D0B938C|nr:MULTISPECIES: hydrogen peroxide-inducible genes activator [Corynebacterium]MCZ9308503.1 LysR substrate-binding domain-containing protein [Corynebacterium sp. c6VSa_13]UDL74160.1 LysR family transcriptional regulator [Corynebacterium uberis]UDL74956.1 LysR family transcriptional regulator [Corynebacterium uberis]UDL77171.1 LysR family transcriptional regulator [Corynebacterium uberis]UDL81585.1 LysR family transcriptional regulator [Corynebacterium uberis]
MHSKEYRPTLAQLRTFVTIAENKHFGTAAAKLGISQPSLSQALVALENGLGIQLIERSTRKVIITPVGAQLLPYAKATLDAAEAFFTHSRGIHGQLTGPLTIGIIPTIAPYILPELLPALRTHFPRLEPRFVEDRTEPLVSMLRDGRIDVAVMALPSESNGMVDQPLYDEPFVIVVPADHPLAGQCDLGLDALDELKLLLLDDGHCLHNQIIELCRKAHVNTKDAASAVTRASSLATVVQLVDAGLGSTLVPASAVSVECTRPGLATATFAEDVSAHRNVGLVYRGSTSRAEEFTKIGKIVAQAFSAAMKSCPLALPTTIHVGSDAAADSSAQL